MSAPTAAQYAGIEAMMHGIDDVLKMKNDYLNRRNLLVNRLNRMGFKTTCPHGTFYVFPNIQRTGMTSDEFCSKLLEEELVACVPGTAFGDSGEGFIRISYAYSLDHIKQALDRMEHFIQNHPLKDID